MHNDPAASSTEYGESVTLAGKKESDAAPDGIPVVDAVSLKVVPLVGVSL